jgi:hypothetical protein
MTDDERREWLASLRFGDRVAFDLGLGWLRGCTLHSRTPGYSVCPENHTWFVYADSIEPDEPPSVVHEAAMQPLPYPEWAGILIEVPKPEPPRRRRPRARAKAATA